MKLKKGRYRYNGFCKKWKLVKLGNIVEINPKSFLPRTFKYVDLESVVGTELISYREEFRESAPSRAQRVAQKGDVFYQTVRPYQKNNYLFDLNENDYVFSTGYAQLRPKVDSAFLLARLQEEGFVNKVIERCSGTSYPAINSKDLSRISITIPDDFDEQSSIGSLFRTLDDLLASYKDNIANYQSLKTTMLSKMFPKVGQTVPEIRLDGFEGEWEVQTLKELASFSKGNGYTKNDLVNSGEEIILYGRLYTNYQTVISKVNTFVTTVKANAVISKGGEVIVPASGESAEDISRASVVEKSGVILGGDLNIIYPDENKVDSIFLALTISNGSQQKELIKRAQGKSVVHLRNNDLEKVVLHYPSMEEQQAIGSYFSNLDNLIAAHQEKISQLETLKKKLLQDMFI